MKLKSLTKSELIAPCGMDCGICMAYLREKNKCMGCRAIDTNKAISVIRCKIKTCNKLNSRFCYECKEFPCDKINHIDKRYQTKYNMSMIENLDYIKRSGIRKFLSNEKIRWTCPKCGETICVHKGYCLKCNKKN